MSEKTMEERMKLAEDTLAGHRYLIDEIRKENAILLDLHKKLEAKVAQK